ncbi:hypothetical protein [Staphylococcus phage PT94]
MPTESLSFKNIHSKLFLLNFYIIIILYTSTVVKNFLIKF